ncbi:hypothetical protein GGP84_002871 [Salinibacter ruber]|nr:hypothetical protein [Salinibacter ruber]
MIFRLVVRIPLILLFAFIPLERSVAQSENESRENGWAEPEEYTKVSAGVAFPLSDLGETYETGIGGAADFMYLVGKNYDAGVRLSVAHHSFDESSLTSSVPTEGLDLLIITGFAKVELRPKFSTYQRRYMPYATGGIGVFSQEVLSGSIANQEVNSSSEATLGYSLGLGVRSKSGAFLEVGYLVGPTEEEGTELAKITLGWKIF